MPGLQVDVTAYYKDFRNLLGVERITTIDAVGYQRFINRDYGYSKGTHGVGQEVDRVGSPAR